MRDQALHDQTLRAQTIRAQARHDQARHDQAGRNQAYHDQVPGDQALLDQAQHDQSGRDQHGRDQHGRDQHGRDQAFRAFFERHHVELAGLAYLMTGDTSAADDLAADALTEVWRHWDRVMAAGDPAAYAHGIVANLSRNWIRRQGRARRGLHLLGLAGGDRPSCGPDVPAVLDVRTALRRLPHRRRACVVLRYAFDLPESAVAEILGISVGTVKSQTSRGAQQLADLLRDLRLPDQLGGWKVAR